MSVEDKDKKEYEFIKEQVIQKKRKKLRKYLVPFFMTLFMAILFGVVAAVTFCLTEPGFYRILHKQEQVKTPIIFPTSSPTANPDNDETNVKEEPTPTPVEEDPTELLEVNGQEAGSENQKSQIIINRIEADLEDYIRMTDEVRVVATKAGKSLVTIIGIVEGKDWLGYPTETINQTSGLIIFNDGTDLIILVSYDRVRNASTIKIKLSETDFADAKLLDYESEVNLATLSVSIKDIPPLHLNNNLAVATLGESYSITVGNSIIALGNPNGYPNSIEFGIITSKGSTINITDNKLDLFNTNIVDNSYSDGVIVNMKGEVIGVITRTLRKGLNENLNTVIGISKIKPLIERLAKAEPRIYCGVVAEDMTDAAKAEYEVLNGIYVNEVRANSPAFKAGLRSGDIILMVDDRSIMNTNSFYNIISGYKGGTELEFDIIRTSGSSKREMTLSVTLTEKENN